MAITAATSTTTAVSTAAPLPCGAVLYDTPVRDIACAMPYTDDNVDLMAKCCKDADVVSYYGNCGLYCVTLGQSSEELSDCLYDGGTRWESVFCRDDGEGTTAVTGGDDIAKTAGIGVVATSGSRTDTDDDDASKNDDSDKDDKNDGDEKDDDRNDDSYDDSPVPGSLGNAPSMPRPLGYVTLLGVTIGALAFSGSILGAL